MDCEIKVSICCLVYNHEKYLRKCLDSLLMQKTTFMFEILIHDDASTDNSSDIIREYEKRYPNIIKPIYQTENQYSKGVKVSQKYQFTRVNGKYVAFCEGDDYWTYINKIQEQFDIMEQNNGCSVCVHNVIKIHENGLETEKKFPPKNFGEGIILPETYLEDELVNNGWVFQTSSYFIRYSYIQKYCDENPQFVLKSPVGDLPLMLYMVTKGSIYYLNKNMSCYRMQSKSSVLRKHNKKSSSRIKFLEGQISSLISYDEYTKYKYHNFIEKYIFKNTTYLLLEKKEYSNILNDNKRKSILRKSTIIHLYLMKYCPIICNNIEKILMKRK